MELICLKLFFNKFTSQKSIKMFGKLQNQLQEELKSIEEAGLYKKERIITTQQGATVKVDSGEEVIIMCANNYLGLSSHPKVLKELKKL